MASTGGQQSIPTIITRINPPGDEITIDCTTGRNHTRQVAITEFPVEEGSDVTDHMRPKLAKLRIEGVVSDLAPSGLPGDVANAHAFFEQLHLSPALVSITTRFKSYTNMGMEDVDIPEKHELGSVMQFVANFKQMNIPSIQSSTVAASLGQRKQQGKQDPNSVQAPPSGSVLDHLRKDGPAFISNAINSFRSQGK